MMKKQESIKKKRHWTKEEEDILLRDCEHKSVSAIAKSLNRSINSVQCKRRRMGLYGFRESTHKLNTSQVAEVVGISQSGVSYTWMKKGLRFQKVGIYKVVTEETLVKFMQKHPELWTASRCDYYYFSKYKWFRERLERERAGLEMSEHEKKLKKWTSKDISRVKMLKKRGLTHIEIAMETGRTKAAIDHLSRRINKEKIS